jgi:ABC-type proline/glycine betaine transport system substrate-binding protein
MRFLDYLDGTQHPVKVPYAGWTSAQIIGNIANIILKEIMGYSTVLMKSDGLLDETMVNFAAGCLEPEDPNCTVRDIMNK